MEAKDTVMGNRAREAFFEEQLSEGLVKEEFILPHFELDTIVLNAIQAQAEISFKAGIREVVEWENKTFNKSITLDQMRATTTYQAKLKDWHIK